jgi:hypothetical protein
MRIDSQTVYQIFWLAHCGTPKTKISERLELARNTVSAHLSGKLAWQYDRKLRSRISRLELPATKRPPRVIPQGYITIAEASYFFESRPATKSLLSHYDLRTELVDRVNYTKSVWARQCAEKRNVANLEGVCMTQDAARYLYGVKHDRKLVPLIEIDSSETPAPLVSFAVSVMDWTGQPFVTLDVADIIRFVE